MSNLELAIRPFQTRDVTPPTKIVGKEQDPPETPVMMLGDEGGTVFKLIALSSTSIETVAPTQLKEASREVHSERIENKDDPSQFVEVDVMDKVELKDKKPKFEDDIPPAQGARGGFIRDLMRKYLDAPKDMAIEFKRQKQT